jgi:hypothetical protein
MPVLKGNINEFWISGLDLQNVLLLFFPFKLVRPNSGIIDYYELNDIADLAQIFFEGRPFPQLRFAESCHNRISLFGSLVVFKQLSYPMK